MKKTLLCVDTHSRISEFLKISWPHFKTTGFDMLGIERTNANTNWPEPVRHIAVGEDAFKPFSEFMGTPFLVNRWLDIFDRLFDSNEFDAYDNFCMVEWDWFCLKPLPELDPKLGLSLFMAGDGGPWIYSKMCRSKYLFHLPWWMDREHGRAISAKGRQMVAKNDIEEGSLDWMMGNIVTELGMKWQHIPGWTCNRMDSDSLIQSARKAIADGVYFVHGCQNKETYDKLFAP